MVSLYERPSLKYPMARDVARFETGSVCLPKVVYESIYPFPENHTHT